MVFIVLQTLYIYYVNEYPQGAPIMPVKNNIVLLRFFEDFFGFENVTNITDISAKISPSGRQ